MNVHPQIVPSLVDRIKQTLRFSRRRAGRIECLRRDLGTRFATAHARRDGGYTRSAHDDEAPPRAADPHVGLEVLRNVSDYPVGDFGC
jgi:hypothetical protein